MADNKFSRRDFLKVTGAGSIALLAVSSPVLASSAAGVQEEPVSARHALFAALGDTLIPTEPNDPGYRSLERYKITEEVMKGLEAVKDSDLEAFDKGSEAFFGKSFVALTQEKRAEYLRLVIDGSKFTDKAQVKVIQRVYRQTRARVFTIFYQNFPENVVARDDNGIPIVKAGNVHQITNPNTRRIVTGWDIAGFGGPFTWEQEVERRQKYKKYWNL